MEEVCNLGSHQCVPRCTTDNQGTVCLGGEKCSMDHCVQCDKDADCGIGLKCDAAGRCSTGARCYADRDCMIPLVCFVQTGALPAQGRPVRVERQLPREPALRRRLGQVHPPRRASPTGTSPTTTRPTRSRSASAATAT